MGCGGLGGIVSAHLSELGADVTTVSRNQAVASAVNRSGFILRGATSHRVVPGRVTDTVPNELFDFVILTTQPTDVEAAAAQIVGRLKPAGAVIVLQNGLCEERVGAVLGAPERVVGAVVAWGGRMLEPGVYDRTSSGGMTIGGLGEVGPDILDGVEVLLSSIGPVERTENLIGARWSKLIINSVVSSLGTLNGTHLGPVVRTRPARRVALGIITEGERVARARGVVLKKVSGTIDLGWMALTDAEAAGRGGLSLTAKHTMLMAVGLRYRRLYSSLLRAIEAGKPPSIDFLNGEIVRVAEAYDIPTPINSAICQRVWGISRGDQSPGPHQIRALEQLLPIS